MSAPERCPTTTRQELIAALRQRSELRGYNFGTASDALLMRQASDMLEAMEPVHEDMRRAWKRLLDMIADQENEIAELRIALSRRVPRLYREGDPSRLTLESIEAIGPGAADGAVSCEDLQDANRGRCNQ